MVALKRDVLDRQIIDTHGRKVVRVNDIALEEEGGRLFLRRVDIGLAGAVRRLLAGLVAPRFVRRLAEGFPHRDIRWDYVGLVDPRSATIRLKVHQQLARLHPADLADIIEDLGRVERRAIVSTPRPRDRGAGAVRDRARGAGRGRRADRARPRGRPARGDAARRGRRHPGRPDRRSAREAVLEAMEEDEAEDVRELLAFSEDSAGGLMTTEFFRAAREWTAGDVLEALRGLDEAVAGELDEVPVVTEDGKLVGMAPLVRLVRVRADAAVTAACRDETPSVRPSARFKEVARLVREVPPARAGGGGRVRRAAGRDQRRGRPDPAGEEAVRSWLRRRAAPAVAPHRLAVRDPRAGRHHQQRRQRRGRHLHLLAGRGPLRLLAAVDPAAGHGRAGRGAGDVRAHGHRHRQGARRPDPRALRPAHHLPRDDGGAGHQLRQRGGGVRRASPRASSCSGSAATSRCRSARRSSGGWSCSAATSRWRRPSSSRA